jgi:hypothetical protein
LPGHGLTGCDVELVPIRGGSLRVLIRHAGQAQSARVVESVAKENEALLTFDHTATSAISSKC